MDSTGESLDSPLVTIHRRAFLRRRGFLRCIYMEWYERILEALNESSRKGTVLELGSGPGFLKEVIPHAITSEVLDVPFVDRTEDATSLSFDSASLDAIVMTDVLHHIPDVQMFLAEALRVLRPGGQILCVEPWNNPWSRFIFSQFHHEPFIPKAEEWRLPPGGPLSMANGALPWIVFVRDREKLEGHFPELIVREVEMMMPFSYLLSGGFSALPLAPASLYRAIRSFERRTLDQRIGMFALVAIEKSPSQPGRA